MKISFIGDISLNNNYPKLYEKGQKPFSGISDLLKNSDMVVGNLESLAEGREGENHQKKIRLKTSEEALNYLLDINLRV